ncbi:MAG: hypothetical protein MJZ01_09195 [Bacteroidales bacterium]|nr:hypothetical protein [Bacteroidales bacterium]
MKKVITLFSLLLMAAVQMWAGLPTPKVEYVQLYANGPKWATMNLGATSVTDAGKYFWWGDVEGHAEDEAFNFNYDNTAITSYGNNEGYVADGKLVAEKDAATQQLGAGYRMPTQAEFEDLYNKCTWTWQSNGYLITGKGEYEDNSIFLPAADYRFEESIAGVDLFGGYYHSTPISNDAYGMSILYFDSNGIDYDEKIYRCYGFPVRPVYDPEPIAQITIGEETTKYYDVTNFRSDFYEIHEKAYVKLLDDITLPEESLIENTNADADITLDLNGHNIIGSSTDDGVIYKKDGKLTIEGDGIVENTGDEGDAVGSGGTVVINEGTYIGVLDACYVTPEATIVINGGKFKAPNLYYGGDCINPIVKGGIFSMDPSDCLAVGYEVVENDDEETKGEYPYKVVELDVDITNPAGLLAVPQAGELDIKAYFTAPQEMVYSFVILHGEYRNLNDAIENSSQEDVVYGNMKPKRVATVPQAISVKDANIALEDGETYTIVVYGNPVIFDGQGSMFEIAIIPFTVGVGEINTIETISIAAGKLDITASFWVSDEDLEAGATYMYALFEGKYASFIQLMSVEPDPVIDSEKITIKSDTENITLSSDEVELEAGKDYTLLIFDPTRKDPATGGGYPVVYAIINYTAVDNSTPTAIEGIDAPAAQKAVKTIENGKIVIIKNGEKYDLAGRKL